MSREVETFTCVFPAFTVRERVNLLSRPPPTLPGPLAVRDEAVPSIPSRKRPRPAYFELVLSTVASHCYQLLVCRDLDDEDSERDSSGRLCASDASGTGKDQPSVQADPDDDGMSDSETREEKERRGPPRTSGKPSRKPRAEKGLDKGPEREYFSPSGVKLEVVELPVKYDTKEWLQHVEPCPDGSRAPWRCTWQTMKNGSRVPCDYSSKKHLVKRHIEATHLCIKYVLTKFGSLFVRDALCRRFQCTWCEKTFTQRSNVAGCHLNTQYVSLLFTHPFIEFPSTGASPHGCEFCEDSFKDPSKRHKHMLRSHGYRPGESRKKFRSEEESAQGQSAHESLEPWKVAATSG
jgi:hypothetical protein